MAGWFQVVIAVVALVVLGTLAGWMGRRHGKRIRGNLVMASILLGFGYAVDPPPQDKVEAAEPGKGGPMPGEPPN